MALRIAPVQPVFVSPVGPTQSTALTSALATIQTAVLALTSTAFVNTGLSLNLPLGTFAIDGLLNFTGITTGTQGIKFGFGGSSAITAPFLGVYSGKVNGASVSGFWNFIQNFPTIDVSSTVDTISIRDTILVTQAGSFIIQAAQNSSSANVVQFSGYIIATKIA